MSDQFRTQWLQLQPWHSSLLCTVLGTVTRVGTPLPGTRGTPLPGTPDTPLPGTVGIVPHGGTRTPRLGILGEL